MSERHPVERAPRWPLLLALLGTAAVGLPFLLGRGLDAPDDTLYHGVIPWEWLRTAWLSGRSPWLAPGTFAGTNLLSDAVYMGPFYPATWTVLVVPAALAYPVVCLLHALGAVLAVRWLARKLGASELPACLAGAAIGMGPIGAMGFVDGRSAQWPLILWIPIAFGCLEGARSARPGRRRAAWTGAAAGAIALMFLGSHLRMGAAAGGVLVLWALLSRLPLRVTATAIGLGLLGGTPAILPLLFDWRDASSQAGLGSLFAMMGGPAFNGIHWDNLTGWLVSSPTVQKPDYGIGAVLGLALVAGLGRGRLSWNSPTGRMVLLWGIVAGAVFLASIPVLRYLTTPLLFVTHPVNEVYLLAVLPLAAATGALALDDLLAAWSRRPKPSLDLHRIPIVKLSLVGALLLILIPRGVINDSWTLALYLAGWLRVAVALWALLRVPKPHRRAGVFAVGAAEVGLYALGLHLVVPSQPVDLDARASYEAGELEEGYADLIDLGNFSEFRYVVSETDGETDYPFSGEFPEYRDFALSTQQLMNNRVVPVGLASARGYRALAGEHKLLPARQAHALRPLVEQLSDDTAITDELVRKLVAPQSPGARVLALHGLRHAVGPASQVTIDEPLAPRCYSPASIQVVEGAADRMDRLVASAFDPGGPALLERALPPGDLTRAEVTCSESTSVQASTTGQALVVVRERHHRGWQARDQEGVSYPTLPVNQVHLGVLLPPGTHQLEFRFVPPGLKVASLAATGAWIGIALLLLLGWRGRPGGSPPAA